MGKRHLEAALAKFPHPVEITWRSFELDPTAAAGSDEKILDRLMSKYRLPEAKAQAMLAHTAGVARQDGLDLQFDKVRAANTFDGHRLIHFAKREGKQDAMKERLMRAYFTEGERLGDRATLIRLASEVGLDARAVIESEQFTQDVRADERLAGELGISGVPFFVMAGKIGVSGAQPVDVLRGALDQAWSDAGGDVPDGPACGPDQSC